MSGKAESSERTEGKGGRRRGLLRSQPGLRSVQECFVDVDGVRTHYLTAGEGPPVVLLHSGEFGGCAELSWERAIPALARRYRVVAPDWLGFGLTDKLHDFGGAQSRRVRHLTRFLETLGIERAAFVGNSMGGSTLARVAATDRPAWPIAALVLASAGGFVPDNDARRTTLAYDGSAESMRAMLRVFFHDPAWAEDDAYVDRRQRWSLVPGAWECCAAARLRGPAAADRGHFGQPDETAYEKIAVPTLLIAGANDPLREPGYANRLHERIAGSELRVYERCGHMPNLEHAERFNDDVLAFLERHYTEQGGSGP